ncbi:MAG: hypothetical protein ACLP1X_01150 [Polyangiaceae bacterium]|jgi:hypothetical protein
MTVARLAISFDQDLARAVRRAAGKEPTSSWLADAARRKLRAEGLLRAVEAWEDEHGALTERELRTAARTLRGRRRK